ncbi:MAG: hypothetical protein WAK17_11720 [Candidatus Nitrosopolaris sp.]
MSLSQEYGGITLFSGSLVVGFIGMYYIPHYIKFNRSKALLRVYCERIRALAYQIHKEAPGKPCLSLYFPPLCFNFHAIIAAIIMTNTGFLFGAVAGYAKSSIYVFINIQLTKC